MDKLVSVVIPTYKRPDTLGRSIDSVLNQSYSNVEIIVVDDNGDNTTGRELTEQFMQKYVGESKVKYVKHEVNKNGSAARNSGIRVSNGEYIMFLDDDDEFLPEKVATQVSCLEARDSSWGACYTKLMYYKDGKLCRKNVQTQEGYLIADALGRNLFTAAGSNLMVRRDVIEKIGGFDESFPRNQDLEFLVKILKISKIAAVDLFGLIVHLHKPIPQKMTFDKLTEQYVERFQKDISELDAASQNRVYRLLNLQRFRAKVFAEKNIKSAIFMIKNKEVGVLDVIRYFYHLFIRGITRRSYGFKI